MIGFSSLMRKIIIMHLKRCLSNSLEITLLNLVVPQNVDAMCRENTIIVMYIVIVRETYVGP